MDVLVVEDDVMVAAVLSSLLTRLGHEHVHAGTGEEARGLMPRKRFDLILLDLFLPDAHGPDLIPEFHQAWPKAQVVTMTGYNSRELEAEVRRHGVSFFMEKPLNFNVLTELLEHLSRKVG